MSRDAPLNFFKEKNKQQYALINLAVVEASYVYMSDIISGSTTTSLIVEPAVKTILNDSAYDFEESGDGYCWVLTFEEGANLGSMRKVATYDSVTGTFTTAVPLDKDPSVDPDRVRIARCLFLTQWPESINFYLPDESFGADVAVTYMPFPMKIVPIGTNSTGEVMTLDVTLDNVNRVISTAIQQANGLTGNRVHHLRVFNGLLDQGKEYCIRDTAYIDSVTIDKGTVQLVLESKYNLVDVQLPQGTYVMDYCRFVFKGTECNWDEAVDGFYVRKDSSGSTVFDFPLASNNTCDHTLRGINGCHAHNNTLRFGGFPTLRESTSG